MKNQVFPIRENTHKVFGFYDSEIILSSKNHKTFDELLSAADKPGALQTVTIIPMDDVHALFYNTEEDTFTIHFDKNGKNKKQKIELKDKENREEIIEEIAALNGFDKTETVESKGKPLFFNLLAIACIGGLTWYARMMATGPTDSDIETTWRRSVLKLRAIARIGHWLGPTGVTVIGGVILLALIAMTYTRFKNPALDITYK